MLEKQFQNILPSFLRKVEFLLDYPKIVKEHCDIGDDFKDDFLKEDAQTEKSITKIFDNL